MNYDMIENNAQRFLHAVVWSPSLLRLAYVTTHHWLCQKLLKRH